jgi:hypothetical protein
MGTKPRKDQKSDLRPDAWERFSSAVDAAIKSGPKHREATSHKPRKEPKIGKRKSINAEKKPPKSAGSR